MTRSLFFALALFAFASCQSEKPEEKAISPPAEQETSLPEETNLSTVTGTLKEELVQALPAAEQQPAKARNKSNSAKKKNPTLEAEKPVLKEAGKPAKTPASAIELPKEDTRPSKLTSIRQASPLSPPSHEAWDKLLRQYVSDDGKVNYKGLFAEKSTLQAYLDGLAANPVDKSWSRNERLAYWINAYNAYTVKLILDHYPVSSITKTHGGKPWDEKWIKLGNEIYSLNNIENDIIRPRFKEPRIHFAVNCAAVSCPPLLNRAWAAGNLNLYLDQQARSFINNPSYNKVSPESLHISKIFEWYASDFGDIVEYFNKYSEAPINKEAKVSYLEYDWALNK